VPDLPQSKNVRLLARMYEAWGAEDLPGVLELLDPEFEW
jgi:ketosteroid isomerase-like protein